MTEFTLRGSLQNIAGYSVRHVSADIIVNANENNFPMPEKVAEAIAARTRYFPFNRYPPIQAENLCRTIADELSLDCEQIKIGNGSSDLLQQTCYAFGGNGRKIAFPYPSFSMYGIYARMSDSIPAPYPLTTAGYLDADAVIAFCRQEQPSLLIICNPNNPTGNYNSLAEVEKIIASVNCPVVVDEAYLEFAEGKEVDRLDSRPLQKIWLVAGSVLTLLGKYGNLICLRTFSKAYGLAAMRCGYAAGSIGLMRLLGKTLPPYHVSAYTLLAAKTVYEHKELYKEQIKTIIAERKKISAFLQNLGYKVWPSAANFVLFCPQGSLTAELAKLYRQRQQEAQGDEPRQAGRMVYEYLLENHILAADFTAHPQLNGCIRLTVGRPEENKIILEKLNALSVTVKINL